MTSKYIFYDLETTGRGKKESPNAFGTTPKWEQIMQIAAIVTDENFQETNQNINEFCRPRTSVISQPGALLTTQKGIREALNAKLSSYELIKKCDFNYVIAKKGDQGLTIVGKNNFVKHIKAYTVENPDVTGAGDTVIAALSLAFAKTKDIEISTTVANAAAAVVVGKTGTATVTIDEINNYISIDE